MLTLLNPKSWPGWSIGRKSYGDEFDLAARQRMIDASKRLLPLLKKYKSSIGDIILEVGPFFDPLIVPQQFPGKKICYLDDDRHVIHWLRNNSNGDTSSIRYNLNRLSPTEQQKLKRSFRKTMSSLGTNRVVFDSIVVSQVLNYINFPQFSRAIGQYLKSGGLLFINNTIDYGIPALFSSTRPHNDQEIMDSFKKAGFKTVAHQTIPSAHQSHQKNDQLLLVLKKGK